jgi:peptidoglycan/LPS O-acetylase OafA/YrhL
MKLEKLPTHPSALAPASAHPAYRPDIDGLRAIAVLSVVLFHAFPQLIPGGFVGVDIFFIISGYLIGTILLASLQRGSLSFADFYARRVRRIFPALSLVLASTAAFGWFALFPDEYKMLGKHIFGGTSFLSNFFLWNEVGYFDTAAETKPLLHLWSLGIEEQYYIFWPVLLTLAWRWGRRVLALVLTLAALSFAANVAGLHAYPSATFYSPLSRVWELLLGALLAHLSLHRISLFAGAQTAMPDGVDGIARLGFAGPRGLELQSALGVMLLVQRGKAFPGWWALLPTTGALMLIAAGPRAWCNRVVLSNRLLVGVGLISYPLYLWHWPLLSFAQIIESGLPSSRIRAGAVLAALLLAWLTWRLVETPLRGSAQGRRKVLLLSLLMLALAAGGGVIYRQDGFPQRASVLAGAAQQRDLIVVEDVANAAACKRRYGFARVEQYCLLDDVKRTPTVVLIGDSHAYHLVAGLTRHYRAQGGNLWMLGTRVPFFGMPAGEDIYQQATPQMLDLALNTASVKTVILSTALKLSMENEDGRRATQALRTTLQRFVASGRTVIYVNDLPELDFQPRACIRRAGVASSQTRGDCSMPRASFDAKVAAHDAAVRSVLRDLPAVQVFDSAAQLCDAQRCRVMQGDVLLYRDTHHLSYRGDLYMGERFSRQQAASRAARPAQP